MINSPILFLIFNRPEKSKICFEAIRKIQPKYLFIAADGARNNVKGENLVCENTRQGVLSMIDWPCKVEKLFRTENLGCKLAVSSAIDWFFSNVEEGIILEDDCCPDPSFFMFCDEMLGKYRDDKRVMHITGSNFIYDKLHIESSYYFSRFPNIWGWATWRRAWDMYDVKISDFPEFDRNHIFSKMFGNTIMASFFRGFFEVVYSGKFDTWDVQWVFAVFKNNGLCIVPSKNLISNIGYGGDATHTVNPNSKLQERPLVSITQITHPSYIFPDHEADDLYFDIVHGGADLKYKETLPGKIKTFRAKVNFKINQILGIKNF